MSTAPAPSARTAWRDHRVRRLAGAQLISQVIDRLATLGFLWVITSQYSATMAAWFIAVGGLPHLLLVRYSANRVRQWGALHTVVGADASRAVVFAGLALVAWGWSDTALLPILFITTLLANVAAAFFNPAVMTLPIRLVDEHQLQPTNAAVSASFAIANIVGPLVAVLLYQAIGLAGLIALCAVGYGVAATLMHSLTPYLRPEADPRQGGARPPMLALLGRYPVITRMLASFLLINLLLGPLALFFPVVVQHRYDATMDAYAWLQSALGAGMVAGSLLLTWHHWNAPLWQRICLPFLLSGIGYVGFAFVPHWLAGAFSVLLIGLGLGLGNVAIRSLFQTYPDAADVPQVMSLVNLITVASYPLSMALAGAWLAHGALTTILATYALLTAALMLALPWLAGLRRSLPEDVT